MATITQIESGHKAHLNRLNKCKNVSDIIKCNSYKDTSGKIRPIYSQKFFNKKFKGNFSKSLQYAIKEAHTGFNNAIEANLY